MSLLVQMGVVEMGVMDNRPVCRWIRDQSVGQERLSRDQLGRGDGAESLTH